jgi:hypothetical protein
MTTMTEFSPAHPRKCSGARRRRHLKQLPFRLHEIVPGAATVLVTSVFWEDDADPERVYHLVIRDSSGARIMPPVGERERIVCLLQGAFAADWSRAQTWHLGGNRLSQWRPVVPEDLGRWLS